AENCLLAPPARLCSPEAIADRCSAADRSSPLEVAMRSPSVDRTMACCVPEARVRRSSSSQLSSPRVVLGEVMSLFALLSGRAWWEHADWGLTAVSGEGVLG